MSDAPKDLTFEPDKSFPTLIKGSKAVRKYFKDKEKRQFSSLQKEKQNR